jgi:VanZ family protein
MNIRKISALLFFSLLTALLALTYWPDLPDMKMRVRDELFRLDYIGHLGFYTALSASFIVWRAGWRMKVPWKLLSITLFSGVILGVLTEYSQQLISGRSFNPYDMMYNIIGVVLGAAVVFVLGIDSEA